MIFLPRFQSGSFGERREFLPSSDHHCHIELARGSFTGWLRVRNSAFRTATQGNSIHGTPFLYPSELFSVDNDGCRSRHTSSRLAPSIVPKREPDFACGQYQRRANHATGKPARSYGRNPNRPFVAVGATIAGRPYRSVRARVTHTAPTEDEGWYWQRHCR